MLKIKDNVDLKQLEKYGFEYNKMLQRYFLKEKTNDNWSKLLLEVGNDRVVKSCGTEVDYEKVTEQLVKADILDKV